MFFLIVFLLKDRRGVWGLRGGGGGGEEGGRRGERKIGFLMFVKKMNGLSNERRGLWRYYVCY